MKLQLIDDHLDNLERRLEQLAKEEAFVGVREDQGVHEPSGLSLPDLMNIHHGGVPSKNIPARPLAEISAITFPKVKMTAFKKGLQEYLGDIHKANPPKKVDKITYTFAEDMWEHSYQMFGNLRYLESNAESTILKKGFNEPLIETSELQNSWSAWVNGVKVR